jgi:hypothetical protein
MMIKMNGKELVDKSLNAIEEIVTDKAFQNGLKIGGLGFLVLLLFPNMSVKLMEAVFNGLWVDIANLLGK